MGNKEPSNHGPLSEQLTRANEHVHYRYHLRNQTGWHEIQNDSLL